MTLVALAVLPLIAGAQNKTYTVRQGDTISEIASRLGVRSADLAAANSLSNSHKLRAGLKLRVPAKSPGKAAKRVSAGSQTYKVRNGDSDWTIAHRYGMTVAQLKGLNPDISFKSLKVGTKLNVTGGSSAPATKVATKATPKKNSVSTRAYKVREGDDDWSLARRLDTRVSVLRELNPNVNMSKLRPGQTLRVPNSAAVAEPAAKVATKSTPKETVKAPSIKTKYAKVAGDSCIIRRGPSTGAEKVTTVDAGTQVAVLDKDGDWYKLRFPKGTVGWMRGDLLKPIKTSEASVSRVAIAPKPVSKPVAVKPEPTKVASVSKPTAAEKPVVRVVETPKPAEPVKVAVAKPEAPTPLKAAPKPASPVKIARASAPAGLVSTAKNQIGIRYRWGGTSRGGFDCSGFVQYVFKKHGVSLPRTANDMSHCGSSVSRSNLRTGDLVLFHTRGYARVTHVGIYLGDDKFIHASSGKGQVRIDSLSGSYYSRKLVACRRVTSKVISIDRDEFTSPTVD